MFMEIPYRSEFEIKDEKLNYRLYDDYPEPPAVYRRAPAGSIQARKVAGRRAKGRAGRKQNMRRRKTA